MAHSNAIQLLSHAARTATVTATCSTDKIGGIIVVYSSAITATPSVTLTIAGVVGDTTYTILTGAAITTATTTVYRIHPSLTASANAIAKDILPTSLKFTFTHGDTDSITYSAYFIGVS